MSVKWTNKPHSVSRPNKSARRALKKNSPSSIFTSDRGKRGAWGVKGCWHVAKRNLIPQGDLRRGCCPAKDWITGPAGQWWVNVLAYFDLSTNKFRTLGPCQKNWVSGTKLLRFCCKGLFCLSIIVALILLYFCPDTLLITNPIMHFSYIHHTPRGPAKIVCTQGWLIDCPPAKKAAAFWP